MSAELAGIRRPSTFLSLAPVHSDTFPKSMQSPPVSATKLATPVPEAPLAVCQHCGSKITPPSPEIKATPAIHRTSSSSSTNKQKFLKLGPVFWGGNAGEDDYAIEE